ncbi:MAG: M23 family metallopeptidase [Clostridia bacterium]|nr:M23 family metallopeptidase [Clostridia bacterium]
MQEQNEKEKKIRKKRISGEKRFYLLTALGCAAALVAIVTVALVASVGDVNNQVNNGGNSGNQSVLPTPPDEGNNGGNNQGGTGDNEQVVGKPEGMIMPVETAALIHDYGFYHNQTLNCYYEHAGLDFSAEVGTEVLAVAAGKIESIYKDDLLLGTEIVIDHGDGLKSLYRFVSEIEGLSVGDSVEQGEVIATVAEASGNEYKDGAHLHFEITESGKVVDPTTHLTLEEK